MMTIRPIGVLVLSLLATVSADAREIGFDPPIYGEAPGAQEDPAIASDGDGYLALWSDGRSTYSVMGARLDARGEPVDEPNFVVSRDGWSGVRLVWSGRFYVAVFTKRTTDGSTYTIYSQPLTREGRLIGEPRVVAMNARLGGVATNGSMIVVSYVRLFHEVRAAQLDAAGALIRDVEIATNAQQFRDPLIASNGREFLIAFEAASDGLRVVRLDENGSVTGSRDLPDGVVSAMASDGSDYLVVIVDNAARSFTVSADLSRVSERHRLYDDTMSTAAIWTGSEYIVLISRYEQGRAWQLHAISVRRSGDGTGSHFITSSSYDVHSAAATNGSSTVFAWSASPNYFSSEIGAMVAPSNRVVQLSRSANAQSEPAVAHGNGVDLVVWEEADGIFVSRVDASGRSLDRRGVNIGAGHTPGVAFDGRQFVAVFTHDSTIQVRFVSPERGILPEGLAIGGGRGVFGASIAAGGEGSLVTWAQHDEVRSVHATAIDRDTRALHGVPVEVWRDTRLPYIDNTPRAAWNGNTFLIAWADSEGNYISRPPADAHRRIAGVRVSENLAIRDTAPLVLGDVPEYGDTAIDLASDGRGWLVTWQLSGPLEIRARRIGADGTSRDPLTGFLVARGAYPDVAWNGEQYVLAWTWIVIPAVPARVAAGEIAAGDTLTVPHPRVIASSLSRTPSLVALAPGDLRIAYTRIADEARYGSVFRVFLQRFEPSPESAKRRAGPRAFLENFNESATSRAT